MGTTLSLENGVTMKKLFVVMALALALGIAERAWAQPIPSGDDFDPSQAASWGNGNVGNGTLFGLPLIDGAGLMQYQVTLSYRAVTGLLAGHCVDSAGTKYPHLHIKDDYTAANVAAATACSTQEPVSWSLSCLDSKR